jgi:bifunctional DNase/RNase
VEHPPRRVGKLSEQGHTGDDYHPDQAASALSPGDRRIPAVPGKPYYPPVPGKPYYREMEVTGVRAEIPSDSPIVLLKESRGDRYLPIWIGSVEAVSIHLAQRDEASPRPQAHQLFLDVLEAVDVRLVSVVISSLRGGIYYVYLNLSNGKSVSSRPSDAICLALLADAGIFAKTELLNEVGVIAPGETEELHLDIEPSSPIPIIRVHTSTPAVHLSAGILLDMMGLRTEMPSNRPLILLKESCGDRYLPIWIGSMEALAVHSVQHSTGSPRPLTHELLRDVLEAVDVRLMSVMIRALRDGIYYVYLNLSNGKSVSSRPSDAISLALLADAKILATAEFLDEAGVAVPDER